MARRKIKGLSAGTVMALILTAVILAGTAYVLVKLSSGHTVDLSGLSAQVFSAETSVPPEQSVTNMTAGPQATSGSAGSSTAETATSQTATAAPTN